MNGYIERLTACGFSLDKAREVYSDIVRNFSIVELEVFVKHVEIESICGLNGTRTQLAAR